MSFKFLNLSDQDTSPGFKLLNLPDPQEDRILEGGRYLIKKGGMYVDEKTGEPVRPVNSVPLEGAIRDENINTELNGRQQFLYSPETAASATIKDIIGGTKFLQKAVPTDPVEALAQSMVGGPGMGLIVNPLIEAFSGYEKKKREAQKSALEDYWKPTEQLATELAPRDNGTITQIASAIPGLVKISAAGIMGGPAGAAAVMGLDSAKAQNERLSGFNLKTGDKQVDPLNQALGTYGSGVVGAAVGEALGGLGLAKPASTIMGEISKYAGEGLSNYGLGIVQSAADNSLASLAGKNVDAGAMFGGDAAKNFLAPVVIGAGMRAAMQAPRMIETGRFTAPPKPPKKAPAKETQIAEAINVDAAPKQTWLAYDPTLANLANADQTRDAAFLSTAHEALTKRIFDYSEQKRNEINADFIKQGGIQDLMERVDAKDPAAIQEAQARIKMNLDEKLRNGKVLDPNTGEYVDDPIMRKLYKLENDPFATDPNTGADIPGGKTFAAFDLAKRHILNGTTAENKALIETIYPESRFEPGSMDDSIRTALGQDGDNLMRIAADSHLIGVDGGGIAGKAINVYEQIEIQMREKMEQSRAQSAMEAQAQGREAQAFPDITRGEVAQRMWMDESLPQYIRDIAKYMVDGDMSIKDSAIRAISRNVITGGADTALDILRQVDPVAADAGRRSMRKFQSVEDVFRAPEGKTSMEARENYRLSLVEAGISPEDASSAADAYILDLANGENVDSHRKYLLEARDAQDLEYSRVMSEGVSQGSDAGELWLSSIYPELGPSPKAADPNATKSIQPSALSPSDIPISALQLTRNAVRRFRDAIFARKGNVAPLVGLDAYPKTAEGFVDLGQTYLVEGFFKFRSYDKKGGPTSRSFVDVDRIERPLLGGKDTEEILKVSQGPDRVRRFGRDGMVLAVESLLADPDTAPAAVSIFGVDQMALGKNYDAIESALNKRGFSLGADRNLGITVLEEMRNSGHPLAIMPYLMRAGISQRSAAHGARLYARLVGRLSSDSIPSMVQDGLGIAARNKSYAGLAGSGLTLSAEMGEGVADFHAKSATPLTFIHELTHLADRLYNNMDKAGKSAIDFILGKTDNIQKYTARTNSSTEAERLSTAVETSCAMLFREYMAADKERRQGPPRKEIADFLDHVESSPHLLDVLNLIAGSDNPRRAEAMLESGFKEYYGNNLVDQSFELAKNRKYLEVLDRFFGEGLDPELKRNLIAQNDAESERQAAIDPTKSMSDEEIIAAIDNMRILPDAVVETKTRNIKENRQIFTQSISPSDSTDRNPVEDATKRYEFLYPKDYMLNTEPKISAKDPTASVTTPDVVAAKVEEMTGPKNEGQYVGTAARFLAFMKGHFLGEDKTGGSSMFSKEFDESGRRKIRILANASVAAASVTSKRAKEFLKGNPNAFDGSINYTSLLREARGLEEQINTEAAQAQQNFADILAAAEQTRADRDTVSTKDWLFQQREKIWLARKTRDYSIIEDSNVRAGAEQLFDVYKKYATELSGDTYKFIPKETRQKILADLDIYMHGDYLTHHVAGWVDKIQKENPEVFKAAIDAVAEEKMAQGMTSQEAQIAAKNTILDIMRTSEGFRGNAKVANPLDKSELRRRVDRYSGAFRIYNKNVQGGKATLDNLINWAEQKRILSGSDGSLSGDVLEKKPERFAAAQAAEQAIYERIREAAIAMKDKYPNLNERQKVDLVMRDFDMPPALRQAMGEITDPEQSMRLGMAHIAHDIAWGRFWSSFIKKGMEVGIVSKDRNSVPGLTQEMTTTNRETMMEDPSNPTERYYTTPEINEFVQSTFVKNHADLVMSYLSAIKFGMVASTGPVSRNAMSVIPMFFQNGTAVSSLIMHLSGITNIKANAKFAFNATKSFLGTGDSTQGKLARIKRELTESMRMGDESQRALFFELVKRQVVQGGVDTEMTRSLNDLYNQHGGIESMIKNKDRFFEMIGKIYQIPDVGAKVFMALNEIDSLRWYYGDKATGRAPLSPEIIDEASRSVGRNYQSYENLPQAVKDMSRSAVPFGGFTAFQFEMARVMYNGWSDAVQWFSRAKADRASGNTERADRASAIGWNKVAGGILSITAYSAAAATIPTLFDWTKKLKSDTFRGLAWKVLEIGSMLSRLSGFAGNENTKYMILDREDKNDGKGMRYKVIDLGRNDPFAFENRVVAALLSGRDMQERSQMILKDITETFFPPGLMVKAGIEGVTGQTLNPDWNIWSQGSDYTATQPKMTLPDGAWGEAAKVVAPVPSAIIESMSTKDQAKMNRLYRNIAPTIVKEAEGWIRAMNSSGYGPLAQKSGYREYNPTDLASRFFGYNVSEVYPKSDLSKKTREFNDSYTTKILSMKRDLMNIPESDLVTRRKINAKYEGEWKRMFYDHMSFVNIARGLGLSDEDIDAALFGMKKPVKDAILSDDYVSFADIYPYDEEGNR